MPVLMVLLKSSLVGRWCDPMQMWIHTLSMLLLSSLTPCMTTPYISSTHALLSKLVTSPKSPIVTKCFFKLLEVDKHQTLLDMFLDFCRTSMYPITTPFRLREHC